MSLPTLFFVLRLSHISEVDILRSPSPGCLVMQRQEPLKFSCELLLHSGLPDVNGVSPTVAGKINF